MENTTNHPPKIKKYLNECLENSRKLTNLIRLRDIAREEKRYEDASEYRDQIYKIFSDLGLNKLRDLKIIFNEEILKSIHNYMDKDIWIENKDINEIQNF